MKDWLGIIGIGLLLLASIYGWCVNIHDLYYMESVLSGEGIIRVAGIFIAPLGALLGWIL